MSFLQLLKPGKRNLFEVLRLLPNRGVGSRVTRYSWAPYGDSYWEVVRIKVDPHDECKGEAWGFKVWKGQKVSEEPKKIGGERKRVWKWLPSPEEDKVYRPLANKLIHDPSTKAAQASA